MLSHEEGHIWNKHLAKQSIFGEDVIQEHEANEFAHYLLLDVLRKRKKQEVLLDVLHYLLLL